MAHNGKPSSHKVNSQDYMNLLYSDSDSDRIPDLKLPPLKGKKQKRKKGFSGRHDDGTCNHVYRALKVGVVIIVFVTLTCLAGVAIWSLQRIKELQDQVESLQSSKQADSEVLRLQGQLASVNKTVTNLRTGTGSLEEISTTIVDIKNKLQKLETDTTVLKQSVATSQDILALPQKLTTLTQSFASMGSDVQDMRSTQNVKFEDFEKRISALEAHLAPDAPQEASMSPQDSVDSQFAQMLNQQMQEYRSNMSSGFTSVQQTLDQLSARVSTLEEFTKSQSGSSTVGIDEAGVTAIVTNLLEEKMANMTAGSLGAGSGSLQDSKLTELTDQVNTILETVEKNQPIGDVVVKGDFLAFKEMTMANFEHMNETVFILDSEFEVLAQRFDLIETAITNITLAVDNLKGNGTGKLPSILHDMLSTTSAPSTDSTDMPKKRWLHIEGIDSRAELHKAYLNSWPTENGLLDLNVLKEFVGEDALNATMMKQFDTNDDDLYSEEEMANALGLDKDPR